MPVLVTGRSRSPGLPKRRIERTARAALESLGRSRAELSILLVGDDEMQRLNHDWRGKDRPTDVLAFPLLEGESLLDHGAIGDVVVSLDTARRQATERGHTLAEEVDRLVVHGVLHLLGYDHEISPREERRMKRKERQVLRSFG